MKAYETVVRPRIVVAVLTYNVYTFKRHNLLLRTIVSLYNDLDKRGNTRLVVVDNGSTDGTQDLVVDLQKRFGFQAYCLTEKGNAGQGMNLAIKAALAEIGDAETSDPQGGHFVVFSNDDVEWKPGWLPKLEKFWRAAPAVFKGNVVLAGGILEPEYAWNEIYFTEILNGQRYLLRESSGGASWSFLAKNAHLILPVPEHQMGQDDTLVCKRLRDRGYDIAQLDLARHLGEEHSTWGNYPTKLGIPPLDRQKWGFTKDTDMTWNKLASTNPEAFKQAEKQANKLFRERHTQIGLSYQPKLYQIIKALNLKTIVETGVRTGVSTHYALHALDAQDDNDGKLFSCDPMYQDQRGALERFVQADMGMPRGVDQWTFLGKKSLEALDKFGIVTGKPEKVEVGTLSPVTVGGWDLFLHDSDHSATNMRWELDTAWKYLKPGGWLVVNQYTGVDIGQPGHGEWQAFLERNGFTESDWFVEGGAAWLKKPLNWEAPKDEMPPVVDDGDDHLTDEDEEGEVVPDEDDFAAPPEEDEDDEDEDEDEDEDDVPPLKLSDKDEADLEAEDFLEGETIEDYLTSPRFEVVWQQTSAETESLEEAWKNLYGKEYDPDDFDHETHLESGHLLIDTKTGLMAFDAPPGECCILKKVRKKKAG